MNKRDLVSAAEEYLSFAHTHEFESKVSYGTLSAFVESIGSDDLTIKFKRAFEDLKWVDIEVDWFIYFLNKEI
jgi:hypothetical protein